MGPVRLPDAWVSLSSPQLEKRRTVVGKPTTPEGLVLEAWSQGFMVGSIIMLAFITTANMRKGVLLHKLVLLELLMSVFHGFWIFLPAPSYAWWLSTSAVFLNLSYVLHNVISWMKLRPFLSRTVSRLFILTIIASLGYWGVELYANFKFFQGYSTLFKETRPWEALGRDPWWIATTMYLFWVIKAQYDMTFREITRISPRFAIMLGAMIISIVFVITDVCAVSGVFNGDVLTSVNPFWKLATVFKCLTDAVVLDDFKTALDRLRAFKMSHINSFSGSTIGHNTGYQSDLVNIWEELQSEAQHRRVDPQMQVGVRSMSQTDSCPGCIGHGKARTSTWRNLKGSISSTVTPQYFSRNDHSMNMAPEDIVPSVLRDVPVPESMKEAHIKDNNETIGDYTGESSYSRNRGPSEDTYAHAMRDISRQNSDNAASLSSPRIVTRPP